MKNVLSSRLYGGLALAIFLVIIVVIVSLSALERQSEETKWLNNSHQVISKLRDVRHSLMQMRNARRSFQGTGDNKFLDPYVKGQNDIPANLNDLKKLVIDSKIQSKNISRLDSSLTTIFRFWSTDGKIDLAADDAIVKKGIEEEEELIKISYAIFQDMRTEEEHNLIARQASVEKSDSQTHTIILVGGFILLLVVIMLVNAVVQTLKARFRSGHKLEQSLKELEEFHKMAEEKNWMLEGVAFINNHLQKNGSVKALSQHILKAIVKYLGIPTGVVYLVDEKGDEMEKTLSVSCSVGILLSSKQELKIGEGIIGSAALHKEISIVKDVPSEFWKVESALGKKVETGQIMCVPIVINDELKGVIELGSFVPFTDQQKLLLEKVINNVSVSINARQDKIKNNLLLEQVQEQKESMVSQQEELRQTNEELSRQAEELQASEEELKTQEEELRQINTELQVRNEAVENARKSLIQKARELEVTSKYKSEFLANMSHELRTPLNSVLILAKLLADNNNKNLTDKQVEYANIIQKSGKDLLELINDILDLSKIEAGKVDLVVEDVPMKSIALDVEQLFTVLALEKGIAFNIKIEDDVPVTINTDKQRIEQVLKNLLSNAFKFTPKNGNINLKFANRIKGDERMLAISVADSGIGISPQKQQLIFEAFQQADGSTSRKYGGTGLGLSISKELVRLLGGTIEVSSEEKKGSTFTIVVPYKHVGKDETAISTTSSVPTSPSMAEFVPITADESINPFEPINLTEEESQPLLPNLVNITEQTAVADDRDDIQENDKIMLIIEDDVTFATILKGFATDKGYKAIVAIQGDEGLHYARKYKPAAVITDIQLPVIDGWSLLKIFKNDPALKNIPVHIISAFDDDKVQNAGALAYLKKPASKDGLEGAFDRIGSHIQSQIKKVLILSESNLSDDTLQNLFNEKHNAVTFDYIRTVSDMASKLRTGKYDCIIADIGRQIDNGIAQLQEVKKEIKDNNIPFIVYLDADISPADELQLKKITDVIVRNSSFANDRLMDELELFLYKVKETDSKPETQSTMVAASDISLTNKKILVVDDDMRNVFALSTALESYEMLVVSATDGRESLEVLQNNKDIDLVLMDIMMPEMDGYEAMQRIRKDLKLMKLPIIALTAKAMVGDREKCIQAGASDYITKPVDMHKLLSLIRVWLAS